jgi:hypothetical protein
MAAEYEVNEIGYIGSIWGGTFGQPKIVGRTIQVINIPNTVQGTFGGVLSGGATETAVYFANKDDLDLNVFNRQLPTFPDGRKTYNTKRLRFNELQDISNKTKVSTDYLDTLTVLFLRNTRGGDDLIPIQDENNWGSFEQVSNTEARYLFSNDVKYLTRYVFLVSGSDLDLLKSYFLSVESQETIFDPPVIANPTSYIAERKPQPPIPTPTTIDFGKFFQRPVTDIKGTNDVIIRVLTDNEFEKPSYINDIHEDMRDAVAEEKASEEFIKLIEQSPDQFHITITEGDVEYNRLIDMIDNALLDLDKRTVGGGLTGGEFPNPDTVTVLEDGSVIVGGGLTGGVMPSMEEIGRVI